MPISVTADLMPLVEHALDNRRVLKGVRADHEERGRHMVGFERVEDARGVGRIGAIVEGQGNGIRRSPPPAMNGIPLRQFLVILADDEAGSGIAFQLPDTRLGSRDDSEELALAPVADIIVERDILQHRPNIVGRCGLAPDQFPESGILAAGRPQRYTTDTGPRKRNQLVVGAYRVKEPDLMTVAGVVDKGDSRVQRVGIEFEPRPRDASLGASQSGSRSPRVRPAR